MPTIQVEQGIEVYYEESGQGDRHIITSRMLIDPYSNYALELQKLGYHLVQVQLRGYGKSTHIREDYGKRWYDLWAADICKVADHLGIGQFVYTGASHGAGVGWHIIKNHPHRLLAFAGLVPGPHSKDGKEVGASRQRVLDAARDDQQWKAVVASRRQDDLDELPDDIIGAEREEYMKNVQQKVEDFLSFDLDERLISPRKPFPDIETEEELVEWLSAIAIPCILIGGMKDPVSTVENVVRSGRAIPNAKTILYQNAAHGMNRYYAKQVAGDIHQFLADRCVFSPKKG